MSNLFTVGQIAEKLDEPIDRVTYIIRRLRMKPVDRVALVRLFDEGQIVLIKDRIYNMRIQEAKHGR